MIEYVNKPPLLYTCEWKCWAICSNRPDLVYGCVLLKYGKGILDLLCLVEMGYGSLKRPHPVPRSSHWAYERTGSVNWNSSRHTGGYTHARLHKNPASACAGALIHIGWIWRVDLTRKTKLRPGEASNEIGEPFSVVCVCLLFAVGWVMYWACSALGGNYLHQVAHILPCIYSAKYSG